MNTATDLAVRQLLARAAYALDVRDMAMLESCFQPGAVLELSIAGAADDLQFEGRDGIMGLMRQAAEEQTDVRRHVTTNVFFLSHTPDRVQVVSNLTLTAVEHGEIRLVSSGYYRDEVALDSDGWRIARRRIELDLPY